MYVHTSFWVGTTHAQNTVPTEEAWVKPKPFAQVDCLILWRVLWGAILTQLVSSRILHAGKGTAVPFLPLGSLTLSLHMRPLGHTWGSANSSTIFCSNMTSQDKATAAWKPGQTPRRQQSHCSLFEEKWKDKCVAGGDWKHIDLGLWLMAADGFSWVS